MSEQHPDNNSGNNSSNNPGNNSHTGNKRPDFSTMRRDAIDTLKHHYDDIRSAVVSIQPGEPRGGRPPHCQRRGGRVPPGC